MTPPRLAAPLAYESEVQVHTRRWFRIILLLAVIIAPLHIGKSLIYVVHVLRYEQWLLAVFSGTEPWETLAHWILELAEMVCASAMLLSAIICLRGRDFRHLTASAALALVICIALGTCLEFEATLRGIWWRQYTVDDAHWIAMVLLKSGAQMTLPVLVFLLLRPRRSDPPLAFLH